MCSTCTVRSSLFDISYVCFALCTLSFLFFQAEDGIRDSSVTGVQTCALPIWLAAHAHALRRRAAGKRAGAGRELVDRSEERRVGKSVDLGGGRIIKKKKETEKRKKETNTNERDNDI